MADFTKAVWGIVMKRKIMFLVGVLSVLALGGCQKGSGTNGDGVDIYYAAIESGDYYEGWAKQLEEEAKGAGASFQVGYAENSVETQNSQVKDALKEGCNVLLCGPVSSETVTDIKAAAGEMPIVFLNNAPDDKELESDKYIYVASDGFMAGQYQAEYILEKYQDREEINVAILKGPKGASGAEGRTNGLKKTLEKSGKKINYVFEDNAGWSTEQAQELMGIFLDTGNKVDCVAANNDDMALGAIAACEEAKADMDSIIFLGVDASVKGCQSITEGKLDFTVYQAMSSQISAAVEAAGRLAAGKSIKGIDGATEDRKYVLVPFEKVDAGNVAQYDQSVKY